MKLKTSIITVLAIILLSNCAEIGGPSLPDEIIGKWGESSSVYELTFEFTKNHVYYEDYASNTGASTNWDNDVDEIIDENSFKAGSYYYYYHVSGNSLNLIKDRDPQTLGSEWWNDDTLGQYRLSKK